MNDSHFDSNFIAENFTDAQSLAGALNDVIDQHAELASTRGRLFSFRIGSRLPTWVIDSNLDQLRTELAAALEKDLEESENAESLVECRLDDANKLSFFSRDTHFPKDDARTKVIYQFVITPASNREHFRGLLSQSRGSTNLGNIKTLLRGMSFLIVDDSEDNVEIACALITDLGGTGEPAHNGEEAIQKALAGHYDLVLMDIQMPVMDGNLAMKRLLEAGYETPVIAVSAVSSKKERDESFKCGFKDYLTKPFDADQLIRTILRLTKRPIPIASKTGNVHSAHL